jgi:hypothetical protein
MLPGTKPTRDGSTSPKLGLVIFSVVLLLSLVSCASRSSRLAPLLPDNRGDSLVALAPEPVSQPKAAQNPLKVCKVVPEEDLKEMRGCLGVYYFDFTFDINMLANPEVSVKTNFTAGVPEGAPSPDFNGTTAVFKDNNVFYMAGPSGNGMMSEVIVTGQNNIVFANTNFNIRMPDSTILAPSINILPAASLNGIGIK